MATGALAQDADGPPGLQASPQLPREQWFGIRRGLKSLGVVRFRSKPVADGFELSLRAELKDGDELQVLEEEVRCDSTLALRSLTRTAEVKVGDEVRERFVVKLTVNGEACSLELSEGEQSATHEAAFPPGSVCGLTARLLLPYRIKHDNKPAPLLAFDPETRRTEVLKARWQAVTPEGTQRLIVGSEEIADTWGFVVDAERKLAEVLTPDDGLRWTVEVDEAQARKDRVWPADDPRHVVKAFLAGVEHGKWEAMEPQVDWEALAVSLEETDVKRLRERVQAALADSHVDESLAEANLRLKVDGEARLVDAEGVRFRLARGESGWRIVGIESR